jgi:hypothetical protein
MSNIIQSVISELSLREGCPRVEGVAVLNKPKNGSCGGLKMAHLPKIALAFEFLSAHPDGARVAPPKSSKSCALLSTCTILIALNCRL